MTSAVDGPERERKGFGEVLTPALGFAHGIFVADDHGRRGRRRRILRGRSVERGA